ncbi:DUF3800 domain-containing protein [Dyadobacter sp. CY347]|uniref:DUF3800 domain-containing protein n=1 Tax=Dyadobacter sp. CY347 TaxID=2909336 RepID=UPI001F15C37B|nr:DUF3800 domain-containing protein [Dyadobacter sp. CY347]MCF2490032.1 DUF3800 domain-containing protein [Dyadobacter sp. CY347]
MKTVQVTLLNQHRFLDEAGDAAFYGKGNTPIVGNDGVSKCFILGMLKINEPLNIIRKKIIDLQIQVGNDSYFTCIPSIQKRINTKNFYFHAKDDIPEVRKLAFDFIKSVDCSFEAIVARKIYSVYQNKHNGKEAEFYADLLSHLLKNKLNKYENLVLNIAHRSQCTTHVNLQKGLDKSIERSKTKSPDKSSDCRVVFNVQHPTTEPLLNIADYFCWAVQRVFEKGETRYYDYISDQIGLVIDLYDFEKYRLDDGKAGNYYGRKNKLTKLNFIP